MVLVALIQFLPHKGPGHVRLTATRFARVCMTPLLPAPEHGIMEASPKKFGRVSNPNWTEETWEDFPSGVEKVILGKY